MNEFKLFYVRKIKEKIIFSVIKFSKELKSFSHELVL
jgi:hypothetical protein